jgi:hypothetical protein
MAWSQAVDAVVKTAISHLGGVDVTYRRPSEDSFTVQGLFRSPSVLEESPPQSAISLFVRLSLFAVTPPAPGDEVAIGAKLYRVYDVEVGQGGSVAQLKLRFQRDIT